jgi:two-component system, OmpR family, response regulator MtrA
VKGRVLVVDDDQALAEMLGIVLRAEGFEPAFCSDGEQALATFREVRPDLVLLDVMLPGLDGIEICRLLRAESGVPIVMLTAKSDTVDVVVGLESGADDYVVKPFKHKELIARVRARLRGPGEAPPERLDIADLEIDVAGHQVTRAGQRIGLTPLEFDLLVALARKPWQVFTREVLLERVWGYRHAGDTRLVNVHVQRLRAKIEHDPENPQIVQTVRGIGYKAGPGIAAVDPAD